MSTITGFSSSFQLENNYLMSSAKLWQHPLIKRTPQTASYIINLWMKLSKLISGDFFHYKVGMWICRSVNHFFDSCFSQVWASWTYPLKYLDSALYFIQTATVHGFPEFSFSESRMLTFLVLTGMSQILFDGLLWNFAQKFIPFPRCMNCIYSGNPLTFKLEPSSRRKTTTTK